MKKIRTIALAALAALGPVMVSAQEKEKVRVAAFTWPAYGYWSIVEAQNLSDEIEIEFIGIEDPFDSMNLLSSGQVDVVLNTLDYAPIGTSEERPISVVAYYAVSTASDKIILDAGIDGATDLVGETVGVLEGGLPHIFMAMWLDKYGVSIDDVNVSNIIADDVFAAMIGDSISAGVFWEPYASNVLEAKDGTHLVATSGDPEWIKTGLIADAMYMNDDFIASKPNAAKAFMRAYFEAIAWREENPEAGNEIIAEGMKMPIEDVNSVLAAAGTDGSLDLYSFDESARVCGVLEGSPPNGQTNGQLIKMFADTNDWWVRIGLLQTHENPLDGIDCTVMDALVADGFSTE